MVMKDASATWALVVGIDEYQTVKPGLSGAARDAVAVVAWLRRLGVPDAQIMLHAAPCAAAQADVDALGLAYTGCTEAEIWHSFQTLMTNRGEKLFVFLSGHGLYEPAVGERVFLTQEASDLVTTNLGITWYARFLRGLPYRKQFVVMDGCLNLPYSEIERARFVPGAKSGVNPATPRSDVQQWLCFAASLGQRALEIGQRGLFLNTLLQALDPAKPNELVVDIDDATGTKVFDLAATIDHVVKPAVTARAAQEGREQTAGWQRLSDGAVAETAISIVELVPGQVAQLQIIIDPVVAIPAVNRLTLWSNENNWRRIILGAPAAVVPTPVTTTLPAGLRLSIDCRIDDTTQWRPPNEIRVSALTSPIVVSIEPQAPPALPSPTVSTVVNTVGSDGQVVFEMTSDAYRSVDDVLSTAGGRVQMETHESGPVLHAARGDADLLMSVTLDVARVIDTATPRAVGTSIRGLDTGDMFAQISVPLSAAGALRLTGLLGNYPVIKVGDQIRSTNGLVANPLVAVDPGPVTVRVEVPWGSWTSRVIAEPGNVVEVQLPERVGRPPVRVNLLRTAEIEYYSGPERSVVIDRADVVPQWWTADGAGSSFVRSADNPSWVGTAWVSTEPGPEPRWRALASIAVAGRRVVFPLNESGPVGIAMGDSLRAEPLSMLPSPHWDRLVSSGRLDDITPDMAVALTYEKWDNHLIGLAGAYALYAKNVGNSLDTVLNNLDGLDPWVPDLPILRAAWMLRRGIDPSSTKAANVRSMLMGLGDSQAVPLFRWGVAIGALAAEGFGCQALAERLTGVGERLADSSVWTMWSTPDL